MRMESGALISANVKLRNELDIAVKALKFYAEMQHFDTVRVGGDPEGVTRTRILDNGGTAEEALAQITG
jgi:hypothetical protein